MRKELPLQEMAERIGLWLKARWPRDTAKHAAITFGKPVDTCANWTKGRSTPSFSNYMMMVREFGGNFSTFVEEPAAPSGDGTRSLRRRLANLRAELAILDQELEQLEAKAPYYEELLKSDDQFALPLVGGGVRQDCEVLPFTERMGATSIRKVRTA